MPLVQRAPRPAQAARIVLGIAACLLAAHGAYAAADVAVVPEPAVLDHFLKYREMVQAENAAFLDFVKLMAAAIVTVATAFFAFLNWRTAGEVRKAAEGRLSAAVAEEVAKRQAAIQSAVEKRQSAIQEEVSRKITTEAAKIQQEFEILQRKFEERRRYTDKWLVEISQSTPQASGRVDSPNAGPGVATTPQRTEAPDDNDDLTGAHILWVDDEPQHNIGQAETLRSLGATVETVMSTAAAMEKLKDPSRYRLIISDMGRRGEGDQAGVDFLIKLQANNITLPVVIFCSRWSMRRLGDLAVDHGVFAVTSTNSALFRAVRQAAKGGPQMGVVVA